MEERELLRIAAFKLQESAKRIAALAERAASPDVRQQLSSVSLRLLEHANELVGLEPSTTAAGRSS